MSAPPRPLEDDARPLVASVRGFLAEPQHRGVGWAHVFGGVLLALFLVQVVTGTLLALYYAPSVDSAWESVRYIEEQVTFGRVVRAVHHYAASAFVIALLVHMTQAVVYAAYKRPRRLLWIAGVFLLLLGLGFGFTGYLLPWDRKAYFGTEVGTAIPGSAPVIGPAIARLLRGGEEVSQLTLSRFYALHVIVLPLAVTAVAGVHVFLVRRLGVTPPWRRVGEGEDPAERAASGGEPFSPFQLARDLAAAALVVAVVVGLAVFVGAPALEAKADPGSESSAGYVPRPEWYFLGLQHLLRILPRGLQVLGTVGLPSLAVLFLIALPFLDRSVERSPRRRLRVIAAWAFLLGTAGWLTFAGHRAVKDEEARLAAAARAKASAPAEPVGPALPPGPPAGEDADAEPSPDLVAAGEKLHGALHCEGCHPAEGLEPRDFAPPLRFEGSRARRSWIATYLREPYRIRFEKAGIRPKNRHPDYKLTEEEAQALAAYLSTRRDDDLVPPGLFERGAAVTADMGREAFQKHECTHCHKSGEKGSGPDLTRIGSRLRPDFIVAQIHGPKKVNPKSKMFVGDDMSLEDARAIATYLLETFK